jgi:mannose-6-phosphate isomerase-like protein (cupin superfamily)
MTQRSSLQPLSRESAEHYLWGEKCDGWFLLKSGNLHVLEERMPPGAAEVRHYHRNSKQLFYVLSGELTMRTESGAITVAARNSVIIEPGTLHQAVNESSAVVEFLVISSPPSHGDRFDSK